MTIRRSNVFVRLLKKSIVDAGNCFAFHNVLIKTKKIRQFENHESVFALSHV